MKQPMPFQAGVMSEVIAPFVDGGVFVADFWMEGRVGAMAGANVVEYAEANGAVRYTPRHVRVLGPDVAGQPWTETMASAADVGWMDGSAYRWEASRDDSENLAAWNAAGCPTRNAHGEWGSGGLPMSYIRWTWENPMTRGPSPLRPRHGGKR